MTKMRNGQGPTSIDLLDVNVWLAYSSEDRADYARARDYWFAESADRMAFCRITALGFLRLSANPAVMDGRPLTLGRAWDAYRQFRGLPEVIFAQEPLDCEST